MINWLMFVGQLALVLIAIGAFLFGTLLFLALLWSMRKGRFHVRADTAEWFVAETDLGVLRIHHPKKTLTFTTPTNTKTVALTDVSSVKFTANETWAYVAEYLTGFDITDLLAPYRDRINWYTIKVRLKNGEDLAIFTAGEYEPKEFLFQWWVDGEARILGRVGLLKDVPAHAHAVLDRVLQGLRKGGVHVPFP